MELPLGIRPQLTGTLMSRDIKDESYKALLMNYQESRTNPDPKQRKMFYNLFRQGLDILDLDDITYAMIGTNPNSMGHWLPALAKAVGKQEFFRIPETTIINVPVTLLQLTRMEYGQLTPTTIQIVDRFCEHVFNLDEEQEYFIKTGTYSSKFDFRNAWVHGAKEVHELGEYLLFIHHQACMMASPLTKPIIYGVSTTNEWVVREFIPDKEENPKIYKGLPLHTEYRVFVDFDEGEVLAVAPYWDPETMKTRFSKGADSQTPDKIHDYFIYQVHEDTLMRRFEEHKNEVREKIQAMLPDIDLHGQWSIDVMQNGEDFWLIDMAIAANSALCEYVPKGRLKAPEENWIPDFHVSETEDER